MVLRWWEEDDKSCMGSTANTSELGPEKLSGIFLLLAIAMAIAIVTTAAQILISLVKEHTSLSE